MGCIQAKTYKLHCIMVNIVTFNKVSQELKNILYKYNYTKECIADNKVLIAIPEEYPEILDRVLQETMFSMNMVTTKTYKRGCFGYNTV